MCVIDGQCDYSRQKPFICSARVEQCERQLLCGSKTAIMLMDAAPAVDSDSGVDASADASLAGLFKGLMQEQKSAELSAAI